mgnify:CR=1 FL=1
MSKIVLGVKETRRIVRVLRGLLAIAKIAMPDSYFDTDRRVQRALRLRDELIDPFPPRKRRKP